MNLLAKIKKTIKSSILCVKYPFLYPRNRFTDKHYNNWKLHDLICEANKKAIEYDFKNCTRKVISVKWLIVSKFYGLIHKILELIFIIPTYTEWDFMPKGWRKAFGIKMCNDIKKQLKKDKILYRWRIMDIKEKYGTLRLYCNYGSTELYDLIDQYERDSILYCIKCGKKAEYISKGWISPYCSNCKIGDNFITISEYLKDDNS